MRWEPAAADWAAKHIKDCGRGFGKCQALGVFDRVGNICAAIVWHDYWPEKGLIELSVAATDRRWLKRSVANLAMLYTFQIARMAIGRISETNTPARRVWGALGGSEYVIPGMYGADESGVIVTLTEPQWKKSRLYDEQQA